MLRRSERNKGRAKDRGLVSKGGVRKQKRRAVAKRDNAQKNVKVDVKEILNPKIETKGDEACAAQFVQDYEGEQGNSRSVFTHVGKAGLPREMCGMASSGARGDPCQAYNPLLSVLTPLSGSKC